MTGLAPDSSSLRGMRLDRFVFMGIAKEVDPEVVATSPYPIKSRVPVCCGFESFCKLVPVAGLAPALATFST